MDIDTEKRISIESNQYHGKITWFVVLSCMVAATGGLIFGYNTGVSGGVSSMEPFLKKFFPQVYTQMRQDTRASNYCKFDSQLLTVFTSSLFIAGLITSFFASPVTRNLGRKLSILVGGVTFLSGAVLNGAASNLFMLILGRVLLGAGLGFTNQSVPLYLSEMSPPRHRGAINNGFLFCLGIGVVSSNFINYGTEKITGGWGWRVSLALAAVPTLILTLGAIFLPDTPSGIIQRTNDHGKTKAMLQRIRGTTDVQAELDDLIKASSVSIQNPFMDIFVQKQYRPQLVMAIALPFFQQVTGINVISFYSPVLLRTIGMTESMSLIMSALTSGVIGTAATLVSMLIVDRIGRRALFFLGGVQMFVSQIVIGGVMATQLGDQGTIGTDYAYLMLISIAVFVAGFSWSWGPLGWLVPSEIFPLEIRSAGQSIVVAVNFLFTFLIAQTLLTMLCHFKAGVFFFFAGWLLLMTGFVYYLLPETKNIPIEAMSRVWKEHWFWKRIVD